jgi:hypothetical protein
MAATTGVHKFHALQRLLGGGKHAVASGLWLASTWAMAVKATKLAATKMASCRSSESISIETPEY